MPRLRRVLALLRRFAPEREEYDVTWQGPYWVPKRREWWPTHFMLYQSQLFCTVEVGWRSATLVWDSKSGEIKYEGEMPFDSWRRNDADLWHEVLGQVEQRLQSAIRNPEAYNARVARLLQRSHRTGRIQRQLTWPRRARRPLSSRHMKRLVSALARGRRAQPWASLSLEQYLGVAALAYDAVYPELRKLTPRKKYERKADGRHGGLLDLAPKDARGFARWYSSREWQGCHPWELVFAHPHGVLLSPVEKDGRWRFYLSVDTLGLYVHAAHMAIALGESDVPFELFRENEVIAALAGEDWVEIGPFYDQLSLAELEERRPGAARHVQWSPPPILRLRSRSRTTSSKQHGRTSRSHIIE